MAVCIHREKDLGDGKQRPLPEQAVKILADIGASLPDGPGPVARAARSGRSPSEGRAPGPGGVEAGIDRVKRPAENAIRIGAVIRRARSS